MDWIQKTFIDLTTEELYKILQNRVEVFVVEQKCPYPEVDGRDKDSLHIWLEEESKIVAYCRLVPPVEGEKYYSIGRVLVSKNYRGSGYARAMMDHAIEVLKKEYKVEHIWLHGQEHLRHFYGSFGFKEVSEVYLEDGIPHVDMRMDL
ncbi:ElaA protein [Halobacillus karajensis]|uniref:Acyltransferase n=1 Tax=Halobacillus karajensis TaxID=195088 RepID=A0A024P967_9BACI|nr:GNAT family N-acetyltransferase [Halobacillus karajensis]CDQ21556.1 putative acyltransferase [Halobacillus karajensis]CDQ25490.1 putative acyltransferase [Halobacillus karajensis]CDQ28979.1 putative acyltransferase [Halobacillus karajensis]SEI09019.1 ElaA protein [Halobacillus karajensis]